jgi:hypothetical protein
MLITAISRGVARSIRGTWAEVIVPNGGLPRGLEIEVGKRQVTGHVNAKGAQAASMIAEHGSNKIAMILQGRLEAGDVLAETGVVAQVKIPKGENQ